MNPIEIQPFIGVGQILFGMSSAEVKIKIGNPSKSFFRFDDDKFETDAFDNEGFHVYYDDNGLCEALEFFPPAVLEYSGINISRFNFTELKKFLLKYDSNLELDSDGLNSNILGLGVYAPGCLEDPDIKVEGIIVYKKGYYD